MALPINNATIYNLTIPSTKKVVKFRPFLVGEQKILLIAQQSEDAQVMVESLKSVINTCVQGDYNINELAIFDLEYIFMQIRAKSVGEISELWMRCDTCTDEKAVVGINIDISKLEVTFKPEHTNKINLYNDVGVVMKYPSMNMVSKLDKLNQDDLTSIFEIITESIDYIYTNEEVFYAKDTLKEELIEFINNLTTEQFQKIQNFFETLPKLEKEISYSCPVCNQAHKKTIEGLANFF